MANAADRFFMFTRPYEKHPSEADHSTLIMLLVFGACASRGESQLSKALTGAVKERKISPRKMQRILAEYDEVREKDRDKAREYMLQVINAIEMGGDSTHIDVARSQVVKSIKVDPKV
jgi:hypothetical protein